MIIFVMVPPAQAYPKNRPASGWRPIPMKVSARIGGTIINAASDASVGRSTEINAAIKMTITLPLRLPIPALIAAENKPVFSHSAVAMPMTITIPKTVKFWKFVTNTFTNRYKPSQLIKLNTLTVAPVGSVTLTPARPKINDRTSTIRDNQRNSPNCAHIRPAPE